MSGTTRRSSRRTTATSTVATESEQQQRQQHPKKTKKSGFRLVPISADTSATPSQSPPRSSSGFVYGYGRGSGARGSRNSNIGAESSTGSDFAAADDGDDIAALTRSLAFKQQSAADAAEAVAEAVSSDLLLKYDHDMAVYQTMVNIADGHLIKLYEFAQLVAGNLNSVTRKQLERVWDGTDPLQLSNRVPVSRGGNSATAKSQQKQQETAREAADSLQIQALRTSIMADVLDNLRSAIQETVAQYGSVTDEDDDEQDVFDPEQDDEEAQQQQPTTPSSVKKEPVSPAPASPASQATATTPPAVGAERKKRKRAAGRSVSALRLLNQLMENLEHEDVEKRSGAEKQLQEIMFRGAKRMLTSNNDDASSVSSGGGAASVLTEDVLTPVVDVMRRRPRDRRLVLEQQQQHSPYPSRVQDLMDERFSKEALRRKLLAADDLNQSWLEAWKLLNNFENYKHDPEHVRSVWSQTAHKMAMEHFTIAAMASIRNSYQQIGTFAKQQHSNVTLEEWMLLPERQVDFALLVARNMRRQELLESDPYARHYNIQVISQEISMLLRKISMTRYRSSSVAASRAGAFINSRTEPALKQRRRRQRGDAGDPVSELVEDVGYSRRTRDGFVVLSNAAEAAAAGDATNYIRSSSGISRISNQYPHHHQLVESDAIGVSSATYNSGQRLLNQYSKSFENMDIVSSGLIQSLFSSSSIHA